MPTPDELRLALFAVVWTAAWWLPPPRLARRAELAAGLVPFAAFGLRVFAGFFVGVPDDDPVRSAVRPLLDWVGGRCGFPPYAWVLDATVALGLVWFAAAFGIPRESRQATAWIIPLVAILAVATERLSGLPLERWLAATLPPVVAGAVVGGLLAAAIRWTPGPIAVAGRRRAAAVALLAVPAFVAAGGVALGLVAGLPPGQVAQGQSIVALVTGAAAALVAWSRGGFERPRSRFLFAMAVGVAAGGVVALYQPVEKVLPDFFHQ